MLQDFLKENKASILQKWFDLTIKSYEPEMVRFLKSEKNQFSNPVRNTIVSAQERIYNHIVNDSALTSCDGLEEMIKLRAVQDFSPSQALSFLFDLKKIIRSELIELDEQQDLLVIDETFDILFNLAFDVYSDCKMKIYDIKLAEIKSRSQRAFEIMQRRHNNRSEETK